MFINIKCITAACDNLQIKYSFVDNNHNFITLHTNPVLTFINTITPFNSEIASKIATDKYFTFLLLKDKINIPYKLCFMDPKVSKKYKEYVNEKNINEIIEIIHKNFTYPIIVKRNSGSFGNNVFYCTDDIKTRSAIQKIYNHRSKTYDQLLLVEQYIHIQSEYRIICFKGNIMLAYNKSSFLKKNVRSSTTTWHNNKAQILYDSDLLNRIQIFIKPIFDSININFAGLDIAMDDTGKLWLIEINSKPWFNNFIKYNDEQILIQMYENILKSTLNLSNRFY